jgi:hypothetical protein
MLILTPAIFCWWRQPRLGFSASRMLELLGLLVVTAALAELLFGD